MVVVAIAAFAFAAPRRRVGPALRNVLWAYLLLVCGTAICRTLAVRGYDTATFEKQPDSVAIHDVEASEPP